MTVEPVEAESTRLADAARAVDGTQPETKKRNRKKAQADPAPVVEPQAPATHFQLSIPPEQLQAAVGTFLEAMARVTKTREPDFEEVKGMGDALAFGVNHTKIAMDEKTGPWVPLAIMLAAYTVPRAMERLIEAAEKHREAPKGESFRAPLGAEASTLAGADAGEDTAGPVPYRGGVA
jgi:hypothetical protein